MISQMSSNNDQFSKYSISHLVRHTINSGVSGHPRASLICASPVIPGLTKFRT